MERLTRENVKVTVHSSLNLTRGDPLQDYLRLNITTVSLSRQTIFLLIYARKSFGIDNCLYCKTKHNYWT